LYSILSKLLFSKLEMALGPNTVFRDLQGKDNDTSVLDDGFDGDGDERDGDTVDSSFLNLEDDKMNVVSLGRESSLTLSSLSQIEEQGPESKDDAAIMNMSLIQKILGHSSSSLMGGSRDEGGSFSSRSPPFTNKNRKVSWTGIESVGSRDSNDSFGEKTYDQLAEKVGKMKAMLDEAKIDLSAEKAIRRKKEKSLIKLAKELTKRAKNDKEKDENIEMLTSAMATIQGKLNAFRSEMDDRIAASEKKTKEYNELLDQAHEKYRSAVSEHDAKVSKLSKQHSLGTETLRQTSRQVEIECERLRTQINQIREQYEQKLKEGDRALESIKDLLKEAEKKQYDVVALHEKRIIEINEKHSKQTDDLRQQLLVANLMTDKIRTELASLQIKASPNDTDEIVSRMMTSAQIGKYECEKEICVSMISRIVGFTRNISIIVVILLLFSYLSGLDSMNSLCSPVKPGTILTKGVIYQAPWWAPDNHKKVAFSFCGDTPRTSLTWNGGRLFVFGEDTSTLLLKKRANMINVYSDSFMVFNRWGNIQSLKTPWSK